MTGQRFTGLEEKLVRLALDPAAQPGEYRNACIKLAESLRRRGVRPEDLIEPSPQSQWDDYERVDYADYEMPFGKFRGEPLREIDTGYLRWVAKTCLNWPEVVMAIERYLEERDDE